ncbi:MAG: 50S ribosomal protein L15 [bacterium JZ-2024 1]
MSDLVPADRGLRKKKRVGRGESSGHGKTSTRGHKGQRARAGAKIPIWFEGGQMPLTRRLPKLKGFKPPFRVKPQIVNLSKLSRFIPPDIRDVNPVLLFQMGLISSRTQPVKILGEGTIKRPLNISAHSFSKSARAAIEKAGGKVTLIPR